MKPYGVLSDSHNHAFSAFSETLPSGINSRLQTTLDETKRCADEIKKAGGNLLVHAGDLFHVRGKLAPSVLNPTLDIYAEIIKSGIQVVILAGNHDLEGRESDRMSNAITALEGVGCRVINQPNYDVTDDLAMIPWQPNIEKLKTAIELTDPADRPRTDLILHAPIDGVLLGIPDHGLSPEYLKDLGYRRILSGHYHNYFPFEGEVYSIGALTHQTWSDVGTKAGFLIVSDSGVKWFKTHAPEFVDVSPATPEEELPLIVDGNFVRARLNNCKQKDIEETREYLMGLGAKGVTIIAQRDATVVSRAASSIKAGASLETSIHDFVKAMGVPNEAQLAVLCGDIIAEARGSV